MDKLRINIGCGMTPTPGWINMDNSFSLKLSKLPWLASVLHSIKLVSKPQMDYMSFCRENNISWADATTKIPVPDSSAEVIYSSHMLEHLDRAEALSFLQEALRALAVGGVIRLVLPDIEKKAKDYLESGDADSFMEGTSLCAARPKTLAQKVHVLLVGTRHHMWMYDGNSLCKLLTKAGFADAKILAPGETFIQNPSPLDLSERESESVYVEAVKK